MHTLIPTFFVFLNFKNKRTTTTENQQRRLWGKDKIYIEKLTCARMRVGTRKIWGIFSSRRWLVGSLLVNLWLTSHTVLFIQKLAHAHTLTVCLIEHFFLLFSLLRSKRAHIQTQRFSGHFPTYRNCDNLRCSDDYSRVCLPVCCRLRYPPHSSRTLSAHRPLGTGLY